MPQPAREDSFESRTQVVGKKRSSTNQSNANRSRKRRRNGAVNNSHNLKSNENSHFAPSTHLDSGEVSNGSLVLQPLTDSPIEQNNSSAMSGSNLGRNRLAMGFTAPKKRQDSKSSGEISSASSSRLPPGESSASPIEISDDEMEESEGGIVINIDQHETSPQALSSDGTESEESGEIISTPKNHSDLQGDPMDLFTIDSTPSLPMKRLIELNTDQLEEQLRYAFFHLKRDQIDLNRPVICLGCSSEGHLQHDCQDRDSATFPPLKFDSKTPIKLWISCCICASKSHLVGDCPRIRSQQADRWSLKAFDPKQITNLSLETGTQRLEKEAENRNMRPDGLRIKGRAGLHHAGASQPEQSSDDEPFLRKPVGRGPANSRPENGHQQRYDRYESSSNQQQYRGGGEWYGTDSFGRRRSRSPEDRYDSYRPRENRPRASPQRDTWRPAPPDERRDTYRSRYQSPPRGSRAPTAAMKAPANSRPGQNIQFSLPTRKGSNTWSQPEQSGDNVSVSKAKPGKSSDKNASKSNRKNKYKKQKQNK